MPNIALLTLSYTESLHPGIWKDLLLLLQTQPSLILRPKQGGTQKPAPPNPRFS